MTTKIKIATITLVFLLSCQLTPKQTLGSTFENDSSQKYIELNAKFEQDAFADISTQQDTSSEVFMAILKEGLEKVNATINDSTTFVATKGQLILYWKYPHTAQIADGRFGYISPEQLVRVDTPCFKFNFSKRQFIYGKGCELYQSAKRTGSDLNYLVKRIKYKDNNALLQFFRLHNVVDGASAEEFSEEFWALINLWSDKELSIFIKTLNESEKKDFCTLLVETSYFNPYKYYKLYYPLTLNKIKVTK